MELWGWGERSEHSNTDRLHRYVLFSRDDMVEVWPGLKSFKLTE